MPLPQRFGRRGRSRGILTDLTWLTDPYGSTVVTLESATTEIWALTFTREDLVTGGRIKYITVSMDVYRTGSGVAQHIHFYKDDVEMSGAMTVIATTLRYTFTYVIDEYDKDIELEVKLTSAAGSNDNTLYNDVSVTIGREIP